jgi:hypothetical protein
VLFGKCSSEMGSPHRAHRIGTPGQEDPQQLIISQRKYDPLRRKLILKIINELNFSFQYPFLA